MRIAKSLQHNEQVVFFGELRMKFHMIYHLSANALFSRLTRRLVLHLLPLNIALLLVLMVAKSRKLDTPTGRLPFEVESGVNRLNFDPPRSFLDGLPNQSRIISTPNYEFVTVVNICIFEGNLGHGLFRLRICFLHRQRQYALFVVPILHVVWML